MATDTVEKQQTDIITFCVAIILAAFCARAFFTSELALSLASVFPLD